jgi:hypothetical protein
MKWKAEEIDFLIERILRSPREVHLDFIQKFGSVRSLESVRKKMRVLRDAILDEEDPEEVLSEAVSPLELLQLDPVLMKQNALLWLKSVADLNKQYGVVHHKPGINSSNNSLVIMISDVHWGKKTDTFCAEVATQRVMGIPESILSTLGKEPDIDEIVILLLGDEVEGEDIYEGQNSVVELPVILQSKIATQTFWQLLQKLVQFFGVPVRVETVPGNHGRMSKSASTLSNWDNSIYQTLGMISNIFDDKNIIVNPCLEKFNIIEVKGHRYFLNHNGVKHLGTPATKIKFAGWVISKEIELLLHGHWHNVQIGSFVGRKVIGNGSVCGPDDLSEQMASEEPPTQVFFLVKPGKRVDNIHLINW